MLGVQPTTLTRPQGLGGGYRLGGERPLSQITASRNLTAN
jgi:hypothetical protein